MLECMTIFFLLLAIGNGNKAVGEDTSIKVRDGTVLPNYFLGILLLLLLLLLLLSLFFLKLNVLGYVLPSEYEISDMMVLCTFSINEFKFD